LINPPILLLFTFVLGAGAALTAPAWQSVVTQLVPKQDLTAAVTSNGVGVNISRAIGPALAGVIIGGFGTSAPFWINALSNFAVIGALLWWRPQPSQGSGLPPERLAGALVVGLRHAHYNPYLRASLIRAVAFFFFASAYWAPACLIAGISWIAVLASLNLSVQVSLPGARGRGLAIFVTVFFGAMTAGSALWGQLASTLGLPAAHFIAAAGALLGVALTWR